LVNGYNTTANPGVEADPGQIHSIGYLLAPTMVNNRDSLIANVGRIESNILINAGLIDGDYSRERELDDNGNNRWGMKTDSILNEDGTTRSDALMKGLEYNDDGLGSIRDLTNNMGTYRGEEIHVGGFDGNDGPDLFPQEEYEYVSDNPGLNGFNRNDNGFLLNLSGAVITDYAIIHIEGPDSILENHGLIINRKSSPGYGPYTEAQLAYYTDDNYNPIPGVMDVDGTLINKRANDLSDLNTRPYDVALYGYTSNTYPKPDERHGGDGQIFFSDRLLVGKNVINGLDSLITSARQARIENGVVIETQATHGYHTLTNQYSLFEIGGNLYNFGTIGGVMDGVDYFGNTIGAIGTTSADGTYVNAVAGTGTETEGKHRGRIGSIDRSNALCRRDIEAGSRKTKIKPQRSKGNRCRRCRRWKQGKL
jgi:hypothetical protein